MGGLIELTIVWMGRNWDLIGFLNGDLSGLVGTLLFSVVVVEGDVGVEWMDTIKTPFRIPRAVFVRVGFQCCIVY